MNRAWEKRRRQRKRPTPGVGIWECPPQETRKLENRDVERVLNGTTLPLHPERQSQRQRSDYVEERVVARSTLEDCVTIQHRGRGSFQSQRQRRKEDHLFLSGRQRSEPTLSILPSGRRGEESVQHQLKRDQPVERYPTQEDGQEPKRRRRMKKNHPPMRKQLGIPGVGKGRFHELEKGRRRPRPEPTATATFMSMPSTVPDGGSRAKKNRGSLCPVEGCQMVTRKMQDHALLAHLPRYYGDRFPKENPPVEEVTEKILRGLDQLTTWILGPRSNLWDLLKFFNQNVQMAPDCIVHENSIAGMRHLCRDQGWNIPVNFSLNPLNSPACLRHWRVLLHLLNFITPDQRSDFRLFLVPTPSYSSEQAQQEWDQELLAMNSSETMWLPKDWVATNETRSLPRDLAETTGVMWMPEDRMVGPEEVSETVQMLMEEPTQGQGGFNHLYDSHFHLDRTWERTFGRTPKGTSQELMAADPEVRHPLGHLPVWGVEGYCDPHTYPSQISIDPRYKTAVGLHPKEASCLNDRVFRDLLRHWSDDHCIVGEIGLDHSVPAKEWKKQEMVLRELLPYVPAGRPVIIHVSGPEGDEEARSTHSRAISVLREILPRDQPIDVHCFTGWKGTVHDWLNVFPQTYFGFNACASRFTQDQVEGLRSVPGDRVLLETDSPNMPPVGYRTNSPSLLCLVADIVADARGVTTKELLSATNNNAARFFGL